MAGEPTLRRGSRGPDVVRLQRQLGAAGFNPGAADGIFGAKLRGGTRVPNRSRVECRRHRRTQDVGRARIRRSAQRARWPGFPSTSV